MKINKSLSLPLYQQVKRYLEEKITLKEWEAGHRLPTEKELSSQFNVSTITIKRAIHDLVDEGFLYRQSGKGTFVTDKKEQNISRLVSLRNEAWEDHNHPHRTLNFNREKAGRKIGKLLGLSEKQEVYKINRIKLQGDKPIAIEHSFIPTSLVPNLNPSDIENELLYNLFEERYHVKLEKAKVYFNTTLADEYEANLLKIPLGEQLFVLERYTLTEAKDVIEYSRFILKQDQSRYFLEVPL
ncbi:GntR family transcriptional regulator [Halobacillus naozhouensis]|uniref:GntR family transcriptional regulator n=1 Tax=Halobacillus naozhouensis TaxID=554880 RepID=A0ABY8IVP6_9BACI|nr:GntR family transcriptional regulator [Halobacillus naozhouensis]WFT74264.1 GntR family transcriptional regulator [Halobacillus naozhouensis]